MPQEPIVAHITDVIGYKSCRRRWQWSSRYKENLEPKRPYAPFFSGSAVHYCIEELRSEGIAPLTSLAAYLRRELVTLRENNQMWLVERPGIKKQVKLIRSMLEQYIDWTRANKGPFSDNNLEPLAHECKFGPEDDADFPGVLLKVNGKVLDPPVMLAGKFDGLEKRKSDNTIWIGEYKTCRGIEERAKLLQHDEQATAYVYAASELIGRDVSGILYTLIRKKEAGVPKVLNSGELSAAKQIDTTVHIFRRAIRNYYGPVQGTDEKFIQHRFGEVLANIAAFGEPFVARVAIERTQAQIDLYIKELHATVVEMHAADTVMYANRTWSCPGCWFRQPCLARDMGDSQRELLLLNTDYQLRHQDTDKDEEINYA